MQNLLPVTDKQKPLLIGLTVLVVLFGISVRLNGLGVWPLSVDEYYLTKGVLSILDDGLPGYACGGFYTRGVLQQYVSALPVALMDNTELAMRLYPMLAGFLMLWFLFLLGKRSGGLLAGCLALILAALSLWEIEYARFARMYMPFQALVVIQAYLLLRVVLDGADEKFKWLLLACLVGVFTYEGAVFLAAAPLLALIRRRSLWTGWNLVFTAGVLFLVVGWQKISFESMGVVRPPLPADVVAYLASRAGGGGGMISYPDLGHLGLLLAQPGWLAALLVITLVAGLFTLRFVRTVPPVGIVFWALALGSAALSLVSLGVLIYLCMTLLLLDGEQRRVARRFVYLVVVPAFLVLAVFWVAFLVLNGHMEPRVVAAILIKYPNVFRPMQYFLLDVVPVLMLVLLLPVALYAVLLFFRDDLNNDAFVLLGGLTLAFYTGVALLNLAHFETRYLLFIYPLLLCLFGVAMTGLAAVVSESPRAGLLLPLLVIGIFAATEDFDLHHYLNINSAEINYRVNFPRKLAEHYKSRNDNRTPAHYINERAKDVDTVITGESAPEFYLDRVDYRYLEIETRTFPHHILCGVEHDKWSNAPLLYQEEQIAQLQEKAPGDIWLVDTIRYYGDWEKKMQKYEVYRAPDQRTRVLRIPAGKG